MAANGVACRLIVARRRIPRYADKAMTGRKISRAPRRNHLFFQALLPAIAAQLLQGLRQSWRVEAPIVHPQAAPLLEAGQPVIYALWHGRMYSLLKGVPLERVAVLVSPSNDGEFITQVAQRVGVRHFIRGAHKRGGLHALLGLRKALLEQSYSIAFTVDGPRGPRYRVKPGVIRLAAQTGVPIVPFGASSQWLMRKFDRAWDHFHAPMPFTGMHLTYGQPLWVPQNATDDEIQVMTQQLEAELMRIHLEADALYGFKNQERL